MDDEAEYVCPMCGEAIVVPVDLSAGTRQQYGEDCPVCCHPLTITLRIGADGVATADARAE